MIIKSDIGHLPASLQSQLTSAAIRKSQLWRIAQHGLRIDDLPGRIEFHACTGQATTEVQKFKLVIADADQLAIRTQELADSHKLAKSRVFELLVKLGWESLQAYGARVGAVTGDAQPARPQEFKAAVPARTAIAAPAVAAAPQVQMELAQPKEPDFSDTAEFAKIATNMLAGFGIDFGATDSGPNASREASPA